MEETLIFITGFAVGAAWMAVCICNSVAHWKDKYAETEKRALYWEHYYNIQREENRDLRQAISDDGDGWKLR